MQRMYSSKTEKILQLHMHFKKFYFSMKNVNQTKYGQIKLVNFTIGN